MSPGKLGHTENTLRALALPPDDFFKCLKIYLIALKSMLMSLHCLGLTTALLFPHSSLAGRSAAEELGEETWLCVSDSALDALSRFILSRFAQPILLNSSGTLPAFVKGVIKGHWASVKYEAGYKKCCLVLCLYLFSVSVWFYTLPAVTFVLFQPEKDGP